MPAIPTGEVTEKRLHIPLLTDDVFSGEQIIYEMAAVEGFIVYILLTRLGKKMPGCNG